MQGLTPRRTRRVLIGATCATLAGAGVIGTPARAQSILDDTRPPSPPLAGATPSGRGLAPSAPGSGETIDTPAGFGVPGGIGSGIGGGLSSPGSQEPARSYTILPRIDLSEAYNTNIDANDFGSNGSNQGSRVGRARDDFITYFTPSIAVQAETARLQGSLFYAPTVQLYAENGSESSLGHNLNASGTLTVLPETIFVQANAFAAIQPRQGGPGSGNFGGFGPGATNLSRNQQTQVFSISIEPYAVHRFGDIGTLKVGYTFSESLSNDNGDNTYGGNPFDPRQNALGNISNDNLITHRETAEFDSGEILEAFRSVSLISLSQFSGGGVSSGAYEDFVSEQLGYAVSRNITIFAEGGYEKIKYNTLPVTRISDEIWSIGVQAVPNPDSSVTVGYGHKYGFNSVFANGSYAITDRTRVTAVYSTGLGTALQGIQSVIGSSTLDPYGNPVDASTGAPTYLSSGQVGVTGNNSLYRIRQFTGTATHTLERDTFSLSLSITDQTLVGTARPNLPQFGPVASSQSSLNGTLSWHHELSPDLSSTVSGTYGRSRQSGEGQDDPTYGLDIVLNQVFTDTLSGYARYTYDDRSSSFPGAGYSQHIVQVGVSKSF